MCYRKLWLTMIGVTVTLLSLVGCGGSTGFTVVGDIVEFGEHPIAGRKIVLCQLPEGQERSISAECVLLDTITVSDENGHFQFVDVPMGSYLLLYDSGLSDFDVAVQEWSGKTLKIGDTDWIVEEFLGVEPDKVQIPLFSELANMMMVFGMESTQEYMIRCLMVGDSPFIFAHDVQKAIYENNLSLSAAVTTDDEQEIEFPALFLGEQSP